VCQALDQVLHEHQAIEVKDEMWSFMDDDMCVEFVDEDVENLDDEYDEEDLGDRDQKWVVSNLEFVKGPVQCCVLDLLILLFMHLPSSADDKFYSPILWFLILYSLRKNGQCVMCCKRPQASSQH
jgi:hypothetical protein